MTIEEKAKAYDKALKRAEQLYTEDCSAEAKDACEYIFPQLAESEDEKIRKWLVDYAIEMIAGLESDISISTYNGIKGHDPEAEAELAQWQKARAYLEKQKEQKPAEWSKEDETAFGDLMWCIEQARKSAKDENDMGNIWFAENWVKNKLKSLRPQPHWKPSEEQMAALYTAAREAPIVKEDGNYLYNLYDDLKKLM